MIKVLIVDDEMIVRMTLQSIIDWSSKGIEIVGTYDNGKQALKHIQDHGQVDLIITDINMPIMNGLELIKAVKEGSNRTEFLVISAYDDFHLVREAFKLGVTDYILKQKIDEESMTKVIEGIALRMEKNEGALRNQSAYELKKSLINQLIFTNDEVDPSVVDGSIEGIDYYVCLIYVEEYRLVAEKYGKQLQSDFVVPFTSTIVQCLGKAQIFYIFEKNLSDYVVVVGLKNNHNAKEIAGKCAMDDFLKRIHKQSKLFLNITITSVRSESTKNLIDLREHYHNLWMNQYLRFGFGKNSIVSENCIEPIVKAYYQYKGSIFEGFVVAIQNNRVKEIHERLNMLEQVINGINGEDKKIQLAKQFYFLVICKVGHCLYLIQDDMETVYGHNVNYYERLERFNSLSTLTTFIHNWIDWFLAYMSGEDLRSHSNTIEKAKNYIRENYSNLKLSVKDISDYLGFSEKYFCTVFSNEMAMTYTDYLTMVRINMAKNLMKNKSMKIYEISEAVGYNNVEHFSRTFKKATGYSPNRFRKL